MSLELHLGNQTTENAQQSSVLIDRYSREAGSIKFWTSQRAKV